MFFVVFFLLSVWQYSALFHFFFICGSYIKNLVLNKYLGREFTMVGSQGESVQLTYKASYFFSIQFPIQARKHWWMDKVATIGRR